MTTLLALYPSVQVAAVLIGGGDVMALTPEIHRQLNFLAGCPAGHTTMEGRDVKAMLLDTGGNMLACGRLYDIIAKDIGAGVYRISLKVTHP